jgi:hypothetical protein
MYNVVIINADNALNPSTKMCLIYTTIQKNTAIFQLRKFKTNLGIIERGDYIYRDSKLGKAEYGGYPH